MSILQKVSDYDLTFGVEIETLGARYEELCEAIQSVVGGDAFEDYVDTSRGTWRTVYDGSLSRDLSAEVVTPILTASDLPKLLQVTKAIGEISSVDSSCGVHVHVGTRHLRPQHLVNIFKMSAKQENFIYEALQIPSNRASRYAWRASANPRFLNRINRSPITSMASLNHAWYGRYIADPRKYNDTRYNGVNLNSVFYRGTVEFRWFNGTVDPQILNTYVLFALGMTVRAKESARTSGIKKNFHEDPEKNVRDWRTFINTLGFTGAENKASRKILVEGLKEALEIRRPRPVRTSPESASSPRNVTRFWCADCNTYHYQ